MGGVGEREREDAPGFTSPPLCFLCFRETTCMGVTQTTFLESLLKHQAHLPAETRIPGVLCPVLSIHSASHPSSKPAAPTLFAITKLPRRQQGAAATSQIWCWTIPASTSSPPALSRPVWKSNSAGNTWGGHVLGLAVNPPPEALLSSSSVDMTLMASLALICLATRLR